MPNIKKIVVKSKSKLTGADITGKKYDTNIKEEAAKIRLKVKMKERLTPYEKSVLGSDAAIKKMNTNATPKAKPKTLNDFLKEGKRPPIKSKKIPSDADVIIKGYNDKKTLSKNKKK